jgi:hypothetical protein
MTVLGESRLRPLSQISRSNGEKGAALLEYSFVLIVLFACIFGIIDFGRAMYTYHFISNAARDGTRYAMVRGSVCATEPGCTPADVSSYQTLLRSQMAGMGLDPNALSAPTTWPPVANNPWICTIIFNSPGCTVQVQATYNFKFIFPLMPGNFTMQSTSQMVISQ